MSRLPSWAWSVVSSIPAGILTIATEARSRQKKLESLNCAAAQLLTTASNHHASKHEQQQCSAEDCHCQLWQGLAAILHLHRRSQWSTTTACSFQRQSKSTSGQKGSFLWEKGRQAIISWLRRIREGRVPEEGMSQYCQKRLDFLATDVGINVRLTCISPIAAIRSCGISVPLW